MKNNREIIEQGFKSGQTKAGIFFDLLTDDMQWTITGSTPLSKTYISKKQFLDEVINPLNERLTKRIALHVNAFYADGDVVTAIWDGVATAIDGKPYNATYCWNVKMKGGKIIT